MYDAVQAMHPKTLSACFIIAVHNTKCYHDLYHGIIVEKVMPSGHPRVPLHLKVLAYHNNRIASGQALLPKLLDLKTVLMPRQWFLTKLDPRGDLSVPELRALLELRTGSRLARHCRSQDECQEGNEHLQEVSLPVLHAYMG